MAINRLLALITLAVFVSGTVHAGPARAFGTPAAAHPQRDAIARQHAPLRPALVEYACRVGEPARFDSDEGDGWLRASCVVLI